MKKSVVTKESKEIKNKSAVKKSQETVKANSKKSSDAVVKKTNKTKTGNIETPKVTASKKAIIEEVPVVEPVKPIVKEVVKKKTVPVKKVIHKPELTIANKLLNATITLFFIGLFCWILSSIVLRTAEVEIAVKAQSVEREIQEIEQDIRGLNIEIFELKSKDRLMEIAAELGMVFAWDRIKVIQD